MRIGQRWVAMAARLFDSPATAIGVIVVLLILAVAVVGPFVAPYGSNEMALKDLLSPPSLSHLFGTDQFGRDILTRLLYGARLSLFVSVAATLLAAGAGMAVGLMSGYVGGWLDEIVMRVIDMFMAFPLIVLAIVLAWVLGPGIINLALVIGLIRIPQFARLVRGSVLTLKQEAYVDAARLMGERGARIAVFHVLPGAVTPLVVYGSLSLATAISAEAALSFLGLGIQPPDPSWGTMIANGQAYMFDAPWIATFPGLAISVAIFGFNLLGDGIRDLLDPRLSSQT